MIQSIMIGAQMKKKIIIYGKFDKSEITVFIDSESIVEKEFWINGSEFSQEELEELIVNIQEAIQTANKKDW